jgi:uncharacterized Rossmann fold enzyme
MENRVLYAMATNEAKSESDAQTATVSERKFNGTATLNVVAENKRQAKTAARRYFRETHGSDPSKVIAEETTGAMFSDEGIEFEVMVADHSSGSLADSAKYEF